MAWFKREDQKLPVGEQVNRVPEGLWIKCAGCREIIYRKDVLQNASVCPKCALPFPDHRAGTAGTALRWALRGIRPDPGERRPLEIQGHQGLFGPPAGRRGEDRRKGRPGERLRQARRPRGPDLRHGVWLHRRIDGSGGGREDHAGGRARDGHQGASDRGLLLGRRSHDGGGAVAHADGQDLRRPRPTGRREDSLHLRV